MAVVGQKPSVTIDDIERQIKGVGKEQAKVQAQRRKQMDGFVKMVTTAAKHQMPGDENNSTQNMMQLAGLMGQAQMFDGMQESLDDLSHSLQQNMVVKYQGLVGKSVEVNDSTRTYTGKPVTFQYTLDFEQGKLPSGAMVSTVVSVADEKGRKVYEGKGKTVPGDHELRWNGRGTDGKEVPEGAYTINVKSGYTYFMDGNEVREEIRAHSSKSGMVDEVLSEDGSAYLMVDGAKVEPENIVALSAEQPDSTNTQLKRMSPTDATVLIGKEVTIEPNKVELTGGRGDVHFLMDEAHARSDVKVEFFDENGRVVSVATHQMPRLEKGINKFTWNGDKARSVADIERARAAHEALPKMADGIYSYRVSLKNEDGRYQTVVNKVNTVVNAIEANSMGHASLQCANDVVCDSAWVTRVSPVAEAAEADDWFEEGRKYLGRNCGFKTFMDYEAGKTAEVVFDIPLLEEAGKNYTGAKVTITDEEGNVVKEEDIAGNDLLSHLPIYTDLVTRSKNALNTAVAALRIKGGTPVGDLETYEKLKAAGGVYAQHADALLHNLCVAGKMKTNDVNAVTHEIAADPYNQFTWDGENDDGEAVEAGRYYYTISYSVSDGSNGVIVTSAAQITNLSQGEDGAVLLHTATGQILRESDVISIG